MESFSITNLLLSWNGEQPSKKTLAWCASKKTLVKVSSLVLGIILKRKVLGIIGDENPYGLKILMMIPDY
jgi:hypothetical protein